MSFVHQLQERDECDRSPKDFIQNISLYEKKKPEYPPNPWLLLVDSWYTENDKHIQREVLFCEAIGQSTNRYSSWLMFTCEALVTVLILNSTKKWISFQTARPQGKFVNYHKIFFHALMCFFSIKKIFTKFLLMVGVIRPYSRLAHYHPIWMNLSLKSMLFFLPHPILIGGYRIKWQSNNLTVLFDSDMLNPYSHFSPFQQTYGYFVRAVCFFFFF